jgi:RNA polymerase sigma-70 factor (ECF subfamily)
VASDTEARLETADRLRRLHEALDSLPEKEREILVLVELEELPYREIADRLGLSLSAVKMRVLRARLALATAFRELRPTGP